MKILIAGGGTGGHLYPAVAIAKELQYRNPDWTIEFAGRHDSIEGDVVPKEGFVIHELYLTGYERYYSASEKLKVIKNAFAAMRNSFRLLKQTEPDCVIGTGGFMCGPLVLAAYFKRIPTLIAEQNVIPGFTTKLLSRFAKVICIAFEEAREYMHKKNRCIVTGNPVRREFGLISRDDARKQLNVFSGHLILSFGGSLGAKSINESILGVMTEFCGSPEIRMIHISGQEGYEEFLSAMNEQITDGSCGNIEVMPYTNEMPLLLNAADIVISRSGAMSVSEINYVGAAAVYVPYPQAVFDHQTKNADVCVSSGAALMINDSDLTARTLTEVLKSLLGDSSKLELMAQNSRRIGIRDSSERIAAEAEKLAAGRKKNRSA